MIFAAVAARDAFGAQASPLPAWQTVAGTLVPLAGVCILVDAWMRLAWRRLTRVADIGIIRSADRVLDRSHVAIAAIHTFAIFGLGWLDLIRMAVGDLVLVDEAIAVTPAILAGVAGWWSQATIARTARDAVLIGAMERGEPVYPLLSRPHHVLLKARMGLGLVAVPMLLIMAWLDGVLVLRDALALDLKPWAWNAITALGTAAILLFTPGILSWVWPTAVLGPGPTRDALLDVCKRQRVRIRNILVWQTYGAHASAGLFGVLPRLRYVLFGDAAIDLFPREMLVAVMAHESAHVRRRHLAWLLAMIGAMFCTMLVSTALARRAGLAEVGVSLGTFAAIAPIIAWACRRFEWHADATAAIYLTRFGSDIGDPDAGVVSDRAAGAMVAMFDLTAEINGLDPDHWLIWHGSIADRRRRVLALVGRPLDRLPIDLTVRRIKLTTLAILVLAAAGALALSGVP